MGLFVYTQKGSIISTVDLPTTEIIEPNYRAFFLYVDFLSFLTEICKRFKRLVVLVRENKNVDDFIIKKTLFYLNKN